MTVRAYPAYKGSGFKWIGLIPSEWNIKRFRYIFDESSEKIEENVFGNMLSVSGYSGIKIKDYDDENRRRLDSELVGYRIVRKGQLVVNTMWMNYAGLGVSAFDGHVSPAYRSYNIYSDLSRRYSHYLMRSEVYVKAYTSCLIGIRPNSLQMPREVLMDFPILVPPPVEQSAIAAFLDRETGKIDALVAEQERLIALLKEKRQAVISHAVTKGLNPKAPMKDSGIPWLGKVPIYWIVTRAKTCATLITSGPRGWSERISDEGVLFIQSGDLGDDLRVQVATAKRVNVDVDAEALRSRLQDGDVVVCITGAKTGNVGLFYGQGAEAYINQHLSLIRPSQNVRSRFLGYVLKGMPGQLHFDTSQYGLKQGLSLQDVDSVPIALPPLAEQDQIVTFLDDQIAWLDVLQIEATRAITLLRERRAALISAAVTGKIDVRDTVPAAQHAA